MEVAAPVAQEAPTVLVMRYPNSGPYRDTKIMTATPDVQVVDAALPSFGRGREERQEFVAWLDTLPNGVARVVATHLTESRPFSPDAAWAVHAVNTKLHRHHTVAEPAGPFVVRLEDWGDREFLPGPQVRVVELNMSDFRTTTRPGHYEAWTAANGLPDALKQQLHDRMQTAHSALRPGKGHAAADLSL